MLSLSGKWFEVIGEVDTRYKSETRGALCSARKSMGSFILSANLLAFLLNPIDVVWVYRSLDDSYPVRRAHLACCFHPHSFAMIALSTSAIAKTLRIRHFNYLCLAQIVNCSAVAEVREVD